MKHKIPSSDHFLKNVAEIIIKNPYAVCILPNRRSCRELRKYLQSDNGKIIAISDLFSFENEKIILSLIKLLKPMKIPFSTLYE
ncbi:MAG: hypothetical protein LBJ71_01240, partial [Holosporaceae bacterium]|nr:hypothetical protein [Holosporaceae bacterium]